MSNNDIDHQKIKKFIKNPSLINLIIFLTQRNPIMFVNFIIINLRAFISSRIPNTIASITDAVAYQPWSVIKILFLKSIFIMSLNILFRFLNTISENYTVQAIDQDISSLIYQYTMDQNAYYRNSISPINFSINANNLLRFSKAWNKFNRLLFLFLELSLCLSLLYYHGSKPTIVATSFFILSYGLFFAFILSINQTVTNKSIKSWNYLCEKINNTYHYLNTIHLFNQNKKNSKEFHTTLKESNIDKMGMMEIKNIITTFTEISFFIYNYTILWITAIKIYHKKAPLSQFTLFSILCAKTFHHIKEIISEYKMIEDFSVANEAIKNLFIKNNSNEHYDPLKLSLSLKKYDITISNLQFKPGNEVLLSIKKLVFQENKKYVILGHSGCGKTSLVNILAGLWPYKGTLKIDKYSMENYNISDIRNYIHLIAQEDGLLPISIADNIGYSNNNASIVDIIDAAKKACIHDIIQELPHGYHTKIDDKINLSTGQKQRIILARMFISSAPIIILDESTSCLDLMTESLIYKNIDDNFPNKTFIIIAHRLGVLNYFNDVIFMAKGKIEAQGKHYDLLENDKNYKDFILNFNS